MKSILLVLISASFLFASSKTDNATGLVWQDNRDAKSIKLSYEEAIAYCSALKLDGYSDWRLPGIKELQSIVDITKYDPAAKSGLENIASSNYWSSSVDVSHSSNAWSVYFKNGDTDSNSKSDKAHVRCVRAGQ